VSVEPEDVRALARAFARHLEHLRQYRAVSYVGADPMPQHDEPIADPAEPPVADALTPVADAPVIEPVSTSPPPAAATREQTIPTPASPPASAPAAAARASEWSARQKLEYLRERNVGDCQRCPLAKTRRNIVFGVGNPEADLMFVGEAPGADEDRQGEPFVGAAGKRLDQWITQLGLRREQVYIANVLKCRPPNNRDPKPEEIERCSPFLHAQIRAIEPKVLVALGRFAGCLLLGHDYKLWEMRQQDHRYREPKSGAEIPLVVTYHPSYVIRSESQQPVEREASPHGARRASTGGFHGRADAPRDQRGAAGKTDHGGGIKSEDQKVMDDLRRALSLVRGHA
jgi:DNA polymerase